LNEKTRTLLMKVKKLASHGIDGEKENAKVMLNKLLKKYNISEYDLEDDPFVIAFVKKPKKGLQHKLFWQLYFKLYPKKQIEGNVYIAGNKYEMHVPLTFKIEFLEAYDFYWKALNEDLDTFYYAFLNKNKLLVDNDSETKTELNSEEVDKIKKVIGMSQYIDERKPLKLID